MNERIQELAEQAETKEIGYYFFDKEKFAELIVEECAKLFVDQKYMILNPHEPFANERVRALKDHDKYTVRKIKEHFGVTE
jgi:hypothetical protein